LYWLRVHEIPEAGRAAKGKAIVNLLNLAQNEKVRAILPIEKFEEGKFVVMATRNGIIKKTELMEYSNIRTGGIRSISVDEGDILISVKLTEGKHDIFFSTAEGQSIRFPETQVRTTGRTARGVKGMTLGKGDQVVGMEVIAPQSKAKILTVTENGYGKRTDADEHRAQSRGGKGIITIKTTDRNGRVVGMIEAQDESDLMIITDQGQVIRMQAKGISIIGRNTQGVRLINLSEGERVVAVAPVVEGDDENEEVPRNL